MKHVIITGGTRGIGAGLSSEFLKKGYRVTFAGTTDRSVNEAAEKLSEKWPVNSFKGVVCDVTSPDNINTLWDFGTKIFGEVDIWINNAGISNREKEFHKLSPSIFNSIIDINIKGLMNCTHLAYNRMLEQGKGAIYNMGGLGSDGRIIRGLTPYGVSKRAVQYFTRAFAREVKEGPVLIGLLLPGMVLTDMLLDPVRENRSENRRLVRVLNLMAEEVEPVTEWLVEKIIENQVYNAILSYTSALSMFGRAIKAFFTNRDIVSKYLNQ